MSKMCSHSLDLTLERNVNSMNNKRLLSSNYFSAGTHFNLDFVTCLRDLRYLRDLRILVRPVLGRLP